MSKDSDSLIAVYLAYYTALKEKGVPLVSFTCPHCAKPIETEAAPAGVQWDTHSMCPHCENPYLKITQGANAVGLARVPFANGAKL